MPDDQEEGGHVVGIAMHRLGERLIDRFIEAGNLLDRRTNGAGSRGSSPERQDTRPHGPELANQLRKVETLPDDARPRAPQQSVAGDEAAAICFDLLLRSSSVWLVSMSLTMAKRISRLWSRSARSDIVFAVGSKVLAKPPIPQ
jgi:hypothetical protein